MEKLFYISSSQFPSKKANSVQVIKMCEELGKSFDVTLIGLNNLGLDMTSDDLYRYYGCEKNFQLNLIKAKGNIHYSLFIISQLFFSRASIFYSRNFLVATVLAMIGKNTVVFEAHIDPKNQPYYTKVFKPLLRFLNIKVVTISERLKEIFVDYFKFSPERVFVAHDAADDKKFLLEKNIPSETTRAQVGYIGSLYAGRGLEIIYELALLNKNIDFNIVGGSTKEVELLEKKFNLSNLHFVGYVPYNDVPEKIKEQHVLLAPYQNNLQIAGGSSINTVEYMSPLKIFEYMASKRPVIVSDLKILHEVLDHESACFVSTEDILEWNSALNKLLSDKDYYCTMADNAFAKFTNKHTVKIRTKEILEFVNGD